MVLRDYEPSVNHYGTDETVGQFVRQPIAENRHCSPGLGRPFTEFAAITSSSDSQYRILFRLSHAEYNATSLSFFTNTLQTLYNEESVEKYSSFCRYMHSLSTRKKVESQEYWSSLLRGSSMSVIRPGSQSGPTDPQKQHCELIHHTIRQIGIGRPLPDGITLPTFIRAAWAKVLALHTYSTDVMFGEIVSGRMTGDGSPSDRVAGLHVITVGYINWACAGLGNFSSFPSFASFPKDLGTITVYYQMNSIKEYNIPSRDSPPL